MHCTPSSDSPFSSLRRRKSKTPRNPASVLPLPVGEVSKIECGSNAAGTQSNWACVNVANVSQNHRAKRGCKRANNWRGEAARTDRVTVFRGDSSPIRPLLEFSLLFIDAPGSPKRIRRVADACGLSFRIDRKVFILELLGNARRPLRFDFFSRGIERVVSFAAFWRSTHVSSRVRKRNSRFGQANKFHGLLRCNSEWQRLRISEADVFARKNDNTPRDETKIFAGVQHFSEPVHRAFFVRRAHAFDKRADRVVVRVTRAIIDDRLLFNAFFSNSHSEMNYLVRIGLSCEHSDLESVQTFARVAVAWLREVLASIPFYL